MSAGLSGLIRADKPSNAARTEASSPYSLEAWQRWAKLVWEAEGDALLGNQILHLHLLLPDLDVAIYRSYRDEDEQDDDEYFTASEVAISFKNDSEILFVGQPIEYHRDDNVSEKLFDDQLMINANVVCIPRRYHTPGAWTHLNLAEIDYKDRLCVALKTVWPNVSESNERREVGEVEGTSITRLVTVLRRVNGANN